MTRPLNVNQFWSRFGGGGMPVEVGASRALRVHVTHACPIVRAGLATILSSQPDFSVSDDEQCPSQFDAGCIVITDHAAGIRAAQHSGPSVSGQTPRVLILTTRDKEAEVRQAVDSGVHGYLLQNCGTEELFKCVRLLGRGVSYLSPPVTHSMVEALGRAALTPREVEVLHELARGLADKIIGRKLGIGTGTVKSHVHNLLLKLDARSRTHALVVAMDRGLLQGQRDESAAPVAGSLANAVGPVRHMARPAASMRQRAGLGQPTSAA